MSYGYLYRVTNNLNGMSYVGKHHGPFDPSYLGSGTRISRAVAKYGAHNFSVKSVSFTSSEEDACEGEAKALKIYRSILGDANLYNIADGGHGGSRKGSRSLESRLKTSTALIGNPASVKNGRRMGLMNLGRKQSPEQIAHRVAYLIGRTYSRDSIRKMQVAAKKSWVDNEARRQAVSRAQKERWERWRALNG